jgi:hypothetical protein
MRLRRVAALLLAGAAVGAVVRARRRRSSERVDLYFDDGSMISLAAGSHTAARLVPVARELLAACGG